MGLAIYYIYKHKVKKLNDIRILSVQNTPVNILDEHTVQTKNLNLLLASVVASIIFDWSGGLIWLLGWILDSYQGPRIQIIGTNVGFFHIISPFITYYCTQQLFIKNTTEKKKPSFKKLLDKENHAEKVNVGDITTKHLSLTIKG